MDQQTVLDFWFGAPGSAEHMRPREVWFKSTPRFDYETREALQPLQSAAASGGLNWWTEEPDGALALVILLDQVPRNIYRGTAEAYASDPLARAAAVTAYGKGFDRNQPPVRRWFLYMPFMHSEALGDQQRSVSLFEQLRDDLDSRPSIIAAHRHHDVIARFGRFPHRNAILGRESTAEELAFLKENGPGF
ncbi:MAG: DUF924 family protein [Elsteraceae bacterium]